MSVRRHILSAVILVGLPLCVPAADYRSTVYVVGSVNHPRAYEFDGEQLAAGDVIKLAGGFNPHGMSMCLTIISTKGNRFRATVETGIHDGETLDVMAVNDGQRLDTPCPER